MSSKIIKLLTILILSFTHEQIISQISIDIGYAGKFFQNKELNSLIDHYNSNINADANPMKHFHYLNGIQGGFSTIEYPLQFSFECGVDFGNQSAKDVIINNERNDVKLYFTQMSLGIGLSSSIEHVIMGGVQLNYNFAKFSTKTSLENSKNKLDSYRFFGLKPWIGINLGNDHIVPSLRLFYQLNFKELNLNKVSTNLVGVSTNNYEFNASYFGISLVIQNKF